MMPFAIWYGDGSVWRSWIDGPWDAAPATDVQVVMLYEGGDYRRIVHGEDEYRLPALGATVKIGRWMASSEYEALLARALAEGGP